jgi:hypothetical protein
VRGILWVPRFIFNDMQLIKEYISEILREVSGGGIGVQQQIGIGKNYHTVNPDPYTWENFPGLTYEISADPSTSKYYASVTCKEHPEYSTNAQTFSDEASAEWWVRSRYEEIHRKLMSIESN